MPPERKIFISYRRTDNPDFADRIRDWFIQRYGRDNVFMDFDSIPPGVRFADHIRSSMKQSDAVIAVIGPRWLELLQERAAKFEEDYVRSELGLALELGKPITPICINGAPVPVRTSLPADLRPLLDYNIAFLDRSNFYERIERIIAAVETSLDNDQPTNMQPELTEDQLSAINYRIRASAQEKKGDYESAIADYSEAIRLDPKHAPYYLARGNAQEKKGDYESAIADYSKAIRLDPKHAPYYCARGNAQDYKGDYESAIADYSEAIRLFPKELHPYYMRASTRRRKGDLKGAIADYKQYLDLGGGSAPTDQAVVEMRIQDMQKRLDSQP